MASMGLIVAVVVDVIVLYYIAGFSKVGNNRPEKAVIVTLASLAFGLVAGPLMVALFIALPLLFVASLLPVLLFRLVMIKIIYRTSFSQAFFVWVLSALVSIGVSMLLPV